MVIAPEYYSFVKGQTDPLSDYFNEINVLVRYNPLAELSRFIPVNAFYNQRINQKINLFKTPPNVIPRATPMLYLPTESSYLKLGEKHLKAVLNGIKKYDIDFDIIHAHHTWTSGYVASKLKSEYDVSAVITGHGYDVYSLPFKNSTWRGKITETINSSDYIITVSNRNFHCLEEIGIKTKCKVIFNGFDSTIFKKLDIDACREKLGIPHDKKVILSVGNLIPIKGHQYLIEACSILKKDHNMDFVCYIVGSGKLMSKLNKLIARLGLSDYVKLVGRKPHEEIPLWINASDIFVLPSLNEGNPTVMFEAIGCGKPFIGTDVGGVNEVINNEEYGSVVKKEDSKALYLAIFEGLSKEWNYENISGYASGYSWNAISKQIYDVYCELLC